ncbi:MAG TPA: extracellular solute-binding protein [Anaerolineaceae bacterium]|nr:extracellular solute-binding protein [Anaerolineaceae bacterium]
MSFLPSKPVWKQAMLLLLIASTVLSLAACGSSATPTPADAAEEPTAVEATEAPAVEEPTAAATEETAQEPVELVFWHYFTDRADLFEQYAADYEAQTGVKVKMELYSGDVLGQKFQAAAQAKTLPDISAAWVGIGEETAPYAKEGVIMNLTDAFADGWGDIFVPEHIQSVSFAEGNDWGVEPGPYLVPIDSNNMQILYNKALFEEAGITAAPTTYAELMDAAAKLKEKGIAPFVSGFGSWGIPAFATMYIWNVVGPENMEKTYSGEMAYTEQAWVDMLNVFVGMRDGGLFADGINAYDFPAAETMFVNGQAGMIFDGSWAIGVFNQQNPDFTDYSVFMPPAAEDSQYDVRIPGGVGAMAFVVGTSPNKDEAVKFLRWLTEAEQQAKYATTSFNLPANVTVADAVPMNDALTAFSANMDKIQPTLKSSMTAEVETTMTKGIQRILAGEDTPENVAKLMQTAYETGQAQ